MIIFDQQTCTECHTCAWFTWSIASKTASGLGLQTRDFKNCTLRFGTLWVLSESLEPSRNLVTLTCVTGDCGGCWHRHYYDYQGDALGECGLEHGLGLLGCLFGGSPGSTVQSLLLCFACSCHDAPLLAVTSCTLQCHLAVTIIKIRLARYKQWYQFANVLGVPQKHKKAPAVKMLLVSTVNFVTFMLSSCLIYVKKKLNA